MLNRKLADFLKVTSSMEVDFPQTLEAAGGGTSLDEKHALFAVARYGYTGRGLIFDVGCGTGGSSLSMALGLKAREDGLLLPSLWCFDLFGDRLRQVTGNTDKDALDGIEIFRKTVAAAQGYVTTIPMDLTVDFESLCRGLKVEIAHIDAAKTLGIWKSVFAGLSGTVLPGTIWIFQDFERARLPFQVYSLGLLLDHGRFVGGAHYGTMYFRFDEPIPEEIGAKIATDTFSDDERLTLLEKVFDVIEVDHADVFDRNYSVNELRTAMKAYVAFWGGDLATAQSVYMTASEDFRNHPHNRGFMRELKLRR